MAYIGFYCIANVIWGVGKWCFFFLSKRKQSYPLLYLTNYLNMNRITYTYTAHIHVVYKNVYLQKKEINQLFCCCCKIDSLFWGCELTLYENAWVYILRVIFSRLYVCVLCCVHSEGTKVLETKENKKSFFLRKTFSKYRTIGHIASSFHSRTVPYRCITTTIRRKCVLKAQKQKYSRETTASKNR